MKNTKILIAAAIAAMGVVAVTHSYAKEVRSKEAALMRNLTTFNAIVSELGTHYVDSIAPDRAFKAAIEGLLGTVDPYTEYFAEEDQDDLEKMTTGEYGGIGSYLLSMDSCTVISGPMENSPSARAGLRSGDRLLRVDSIDVSKMTSDKVTKYLRGVPETKVRVTVNRPYVADSIITVEITRSKLREPSVPYYRLMPDGTGYIQLTGFIRDSASEVKRALEEFKASGRLKNVVLDLRGNGGGLLESAVEIAGYFLPKGTEVVRTKYREGTPDKTYKTTHQPILPDTPFAILIDGGTASASEILAGAMQDLDRGVLIGSRSFGKGLVQSTRPLPYQGLLKVTVAKYYTPSGRLIQALDYSRRNEDGSVQRVPDSLTHAYTTAHGRTVRDGGGLQPDSVIDWGKINALVYNLVRDNWIFNYATKFAANHKSIAPAEEFVIDDTIYSDFKESINPDKFKYDRVMEEGLKQLREMATSEGYMNDSTRAEFDVMQRLLTHNLDRDLDTHRDEIAEYLGTEIASRYYYTRGRTGYALQNDKALRKAKEILNNPDLYAKMLHRDGKAANKGETKAKGKNNDKGNGTKTKSTKKR